MAGTEGAPSGSPFRISSSYDKLIRQDVLMSESLELELVGSVLRLELSDIGEPEQAGRPAEEEDFRDLPEGFGRVTPVSRGRGRAAVVATEGLRTMLRPLGPLLEEVHRSVTSVPDPPQELSVQFGIQVGQDLKLGIVGMNGHATMMISATWKADDEQKD
ncbi:CU044_2847 family protein [Streptomyces orinoci]|uniref:CU044_2847 family protein n=1 Tax=Streptomyces orinoci TaxID=67339 RepID=A0ABV3JUW9_STRON|nr:CU044_2847 family protein [Streptomyces orinoci]